MKMDDDLTKQLEFLKILALMERWSAYIVKAEKEKMGHEKFLRYVISESYAARIASAKKMPIIRASIPEVLIMATYSFEKQPNLARQRFLSIHDTIDYYMKKPKNIVLVGPTGCGKTGLGTSYLANALEKNYTGYFISFPELISMFLKSVATHHEDKVRKSLAAYAKCVSKRVTLEGVTHGDERTLDVHQNEALDALARLGTIWDIYDVPNHQEVSLVSIQAIREYLVLMWKQYQDSSKGDRSRILDEIVRISRRIEKVASDPKEALT